MKHTFWADMYDGQEPDLINWHGGRPPHPPSNDFKRVWVTIDVPEKEELWPEKYEGLQVVDAIAGMQAPGAPIDLSQPPRPR